MITAKELNPKNAPVTPLQAANLAVLLLRMNKVRAKLSMPMTVTSGFRSLEDHKRIYMDIAKRKGIKNIRIPMGSQHLHGAAVDIYDPDGTLLAWCRANEAFLIECELWMEDDPSTPRVHFQIYPPKSGNRWFKP